MRVRSVRAARGASAAVHAAEQHAVRGIHARRGCNWSGPRCRPCDPLTQAATLHAHTRGSAVRTVGEYLGGYLPRYLGALLTQVCYQTKILFTAVCSVLLLGRSLSMNQWLALVILTIGIICVQATAAVVVPGSSGG